jgi:hypothetical protein
MPETIEAKKRSPMLPKNKVPGSPAKSSTWSLKKKLVRPSLAGG